MTDLFIKTIETYSMNQQEPSWLTARRLDFIHQSAMLPIDMLKHGIRMVTKTTGIDLSVQSNPATFLLKETLPGVEVLSLFDAMSKDIITDQILSTASRISANAFYATTAALFMTAKVIHITENMKEDVSLSFVLDAIEGTSQSYICIVVDAGVSTTIIEDIRSTMYHGVIIDIFIKKDASLTYIADQYRKNGHVAICRQSYIEEKGSMTFIDLQLGGALTLSSMVHTLNDVSAKGEIYGLVVGTKKSVFDTYSAVIHKGSETASNIVSKIVLGDESKATYRGLIRVETSAKGCAGYQQEDTLLLSDKAAIDAVPDLEIANNDVSCSHGVTTTRLRKEDLFYVQSRGLSEKQAEKLMLYAHVGPVLDAITVSALRVTWEQYIHEALAV
ncbi:MAG: SufD family Fe-S cluster assembly protein [Candidatus Magasanikbacteria bacterium]|jgi:Fe-S cluster assembly protein SufD|nr:SufD family Fe-S cluster assembly protein [Candidatus Magasanikbacteria bacterium]MBT4221344.1 SufD family Fe-S cluster assembly protein [Candidatus Magasanikbacteria bacterium]MBT4350808.1 SufD family Fe-S cluster assembly protein [Candidatus Magasanikbacteria bacterium]MBT4541516.1 SufD family Fe-S cluster assembly protein [Candidatus Magasanikbacteria bacterium]MBT6253468.1 SufD family Fe-S cluster assembly protein [Candidatus Magasanikbacteria bacterium]